MAKKYQKLGAAAMFTLNMPACAGFDRARAYYADEGLDLASELIDYHRNGYVVSTPSMFAMFKPVRWEGENAWFIRFATGNIAELIRYVPCRLDKLIFYRGNGSKVRVVEFDAFMEDVAVLHGLRNGRN